VPRGGEGPVGGSFICGVAWEIIGSKEIVGVRRAVSLGDGGKGLQILKAAIFGKAIRGTDKIRKLSIIRGRKKKVTAFCKEGGKGGSFLLQENENRGGAFTRRGAQTNPLEESP